MRRMMFVLIRVAALIPVLCLPAGAQSGGAATVQISGLVQSFGGGTLDIKPAASPAVWVMVPSDLHIDRGALKTGAQVTVEAYWSDVCYTATQVTITQ
ncbi:MAG TPA: hypothetical protein VN885_08775 [Candidatus Acidoferrales bacterium]|nr:hypothetical protein [Candidatus Acidoferrales bacterium]